MLTWIYWILIWILFDSGSESDFESKSAFDCNAETDFGSKYGCEYLSYLDSKTNLDSNLILTLTQKLTLTLILNLNSNLM